MTRKVSIDNATTWVTTEDVGSLPSVRLHPAGDSDPARVYSVDHHGFWTINTGNGANELFTIIGDFAFVTPVGMPSGESYGFRWIQA